MFILSSRELKLTNADSADYIQEPRNNFWDIRMAKWKKALLKIGLSHKNMVTLELTDWLVRRDKVQNRNTFAT